MRLDRDGRPFLVIGENIHATRIVKRIGRHVAEGPDGIAVLLYEGPDGTAARLPIHPDVLAGRDFGAGRVKHVRSAILTGLAGDPTAAALAADYVASLARRQEAAGADHLDLNADEVGPETGQRTAAIRWLVETVEAVAHVPVSIDSSDPAVIEAGVAASRRPVGQLLLNSASRERPEVLDLAASAGCAVILAATGPDGMPSDAADRFANATVAIEQAYARGLAPGSLFVDPLVLPVAVAPDAGLHFLETARRLRAAFGSGIHLTGGLSNVSYGLPARRTLNEAFIDLAAEAGVDSGIVDPVANDLGRVFDADRTTEAYRLAADLLLGRDPFGSAYLGAFRSGRLAERPVARAGE